MLEIFTSAAILLTLIPGISFFIKHYKHRKLLEEHHILDNEVKLAKKEGIAEKLDIVVNKRIVVLNKIFKFQNDMERSTYFLAAGAVSFSLIELYKLIKSITEHNI